MTTSAGPAAEQTARFVVIYAPVSDVDAFERHHNDVHLATFGGMILQLDEVWSRTSPRELLTSPSAC